MHRVNRFFGGRLKLRWLDLKKGAATSERPERQIGNDSMGCAGEFILRDLCVALQLAPGFGLCPGQECLSLGGARWIVYY